MSVKIHVGDARQVLPILADTHVDCVITDPVWPNAPADMFPGIEPWSLFAETMAVLPPSVQRLVVVLRADCDPRFLTGVPKRWPFLRTSWPRTAATTSPLRYSQLCRSSARWCGSCILLRLISKGSPGPAVAIGPVAAGPADQARRPPVPAVPPSHGMAGGAVDGPGRYDSRSVCRDRVRRGWPLSIWAATPS